MYPLKVNCIFQIFLKYLKNAVSPIDIFPFLQYHIIENKIYIFKIIYFKEGCLCLKLEIITPFL